jgi:PAS domain S-box-containing protein
MKYPSAGLLHPLEDLALIRERYLAGEPAPAGVRPVVLASWERCRSYGVDPYRLRPQVADHDLLKQARERQQALLSCCEPYLQLAQETLAEQPHLFALANRDGLILRILTGPGIPEEGLEAANLFEGASWHERDIGCNGVGTCLATGEPVILIGPEHFQESYVGWTCIGVPIRSRGEIVGALDFSVPNEHSHVHAWGWVLSIAKAIEASLGQQKPHGGTTLQPVELDLEAPFHAVRGVFDLLSRQLDLSPTHRQIVGEASSQVTEAEELLRASAARLHENEERLRRIADSGMVGLLFWELGGSVTYANDRFLEMIGHTREDLEAGRIDWRTLTPAEWEEVDRVAIAELASEGVTRPFEKEFLRKDGTRVPVLLSAASFEGADDRGVTLAHDITDRRQAEREIRRAYDDARLAVNERDHVLAVVSHDLRNPLNSITLASSLLLEDIAAESKHTQVEIIQRAAAQMTRLIEDLLMVARIEGGGLSIVSEDCRCADLVRIAVEFLQPQAKSRRVELREGVLAECMVRVDRDRILQLFTNLISNALEHTPEGGRILVSAEAVGDAEVGFSVRDSGKGIAPENLPHVFDRFWQAEKTGLSGAGLGLAIAKGIVEAHGGRIWVESEPREGTTIHFTVPRSEPT